MEKKDQLWLEKALEENAMSEVEEMKKILKDLSAEEDSKNEFDEE